MCKIRPTKIEDFKGIINPWSFFIIMIGLSMSISCSSYSKVIDGSYQKLYSFNTKTFETEYGIMTFVDEGNGEAIFISHGIFGGYDQGYNNLYDILGNNYRKISISRFGYPGSNLPSDPTPNNQAKIFLELMNELNIQKVFLIAASAGGTSGIRFALDYPEKLKGLILLSSAVPSIPMTKKEIGRAGPPKFILNDKIMLFSIRNFKGIFYSMFGSKNVSDDVFDNLLPVKPRREGIIVDSEITNMDMGINFYDYPVEDIKVPILVVHAKDDPMVKYENIELFLQRANAETLIFPDGGHLIVGHDITVGIIDFIEKYTSE
jgi:pimeloyl-ACP methyl ester carboxylesterase